MVATLMYRKYFPRCPVAGPIEPPVPFNHLSIAGGVPQKCDRCEFLFEGECTRNIEELGHYLCLDYGPCSVRGPTDPVTYEDDFIRSRVQVPRKCIDCVHLNYADHIRGFICSEDADKWGNYHRGLDWTGWEPDTIYIKLPEPKVTTWEMAKVLNEGDLVAFLKEHRRVNPGLSLSEAKSDYFALRQSLSRVK